jgi:hypothetical protein
MSNLFKTNNRFSCLIDNNYEKQNYKNINISRDRYSKDNYSNSNKYTNYNSNKDNNTKDKNNGFKKAELHEFTVDNFPSLTTSLAIEEQHSIPIECSYIDKLKTEQIINENINKDKYVKPGWIVIEKNKQNNTIFTRNKVDEEKDKYKKEDNVTILCNQIIDNLIYKYNNYKNEYIELWGEDEYEKMYLFQNYEYGYFDRLDKEEYEEYMEELEQEEQFEEEYEYY